MKITCEICTRNIGDIAGKLRTGDHAAKFICALCLADLRDTTRRQGDDLFNALFGGGFRR